MFQYAAVRALGLRHDLPIFFPAKDPNLHDIFNLPQTPFVDGDYTSYIESTFHYQEIPKRAENMVLFGYYQSEKYFKDFEDVIREDFTFRNPTDIKIEPGTTSLHVRRGDYVNLPDFHPLCTLDYYKEATSLFPDQKFLVFSDDLEWCKVNIKGENIKYSEGTSAVEDLQRMRLCDNHIIANSSFSWWGAWLGANDNKRVVAPKKWFGPDAPYDAKDLCCEGWKII